MIAVNNFSEACPTGNVMAELSKQSFPEVKYDKIKHYRAYVTVHVEVDAINQDYADAFIRHKVKEGKVSIIEVDFE